MHLLELGHSGREGRRERARLVGELNVVPGVLHLPRGLDVHGNHHLPHGVVAGHAVVVKEIHRDGARILAIGKRKKLLWVPLRVERGLHGARLEGVIAVVHRHHRVRVRGAVLVHGRQVAALDHLDVEKFENLAPGCVTLYRLRAGSPRTQAHGRKKGGGFSGRGGAQRPHSDAARLENIRRGGFRVAARHKHMDAAKVGVAGRHVAQLDLVTLHLQGKPFVKHGSHRNPTNIQLDDTHQFCIKHVLVPAFECCHNRRSS
mmetsp:Transcript_29023/g.55680  ORF Transcript_29023/g.55680 Transcript_29023/m.55680 type:complete len:260 (+) Transcript_29023:2563-3342(+)